MKRHSKKLQFMIPGKGSRLPAILNINNIKIRESQKVIFLGLAIDNFLTFKDHIDNYAVTPVIRFILCEE